MHKTDDLAGATFSPLDGLFNPNLLKSYLRDEARLLGVDFLEGHRVKQVQLPRADHVEVVCEVIPPKNEAELIIYLVKGKDVRHVSQSEFEDAVRS